MKKTLCFALVALLVASALTACGGNKPRQSGENTDISIPDDRTAEASTNTDGTAAQPETSQTPDRQEPDASDEMAQQYRDSLKTYSGDDLGEYRGTPLLPGFDVSVFPGAAEETDAVELERQWSRLNDLGSYARTGSNGCPIDVKLLDVNGGGSVEKLRTHGVFGFEISCTDTATDTDIADFIFRGLTFGSCSNDVLHAYQEEPLSVEQTSNGSWMYVWSVSDLYVFEAVGTDSTGLFKIQLCPIEYFSP